MNTITNTILDKIISTLVENGIDWVVTAIITYFTVKYATRQYYGKIRVMVAKNTMEQGLRALLKLNHNEELPDNAKVIFVEYKGRCYKIHTKNAYKKGKFLEKIRKTVAVVGGDPMGTSAYRPRDYGVLGIANTLMKPVLFNFQSGELYKYDFGEFIKLNTSKAENTYMYHSPDGTQKRISEIGTARNIMIAIPIEANGKLVGGITFDMKVGAKTIYQNIEENDPKKQEKEENNLKVFTEVKRTANNLANAYFKKKGVDA